MRQLPAVPSQLARFSLMDTPTVLVSPTLNRPFPHQRLSHTKNYPSKDSSESAIFSIYSMYGDEYNINSRASTSYHVAGKDPSLRTKPERQSFIPSDGPEDTDLVYYSTASSDSAAPPLISIPNGDNGSSRASSSSSSHPPSSYATPSSFRAHSDLFEDRRLANLRTSDLSASSYTPAPSKECTGGGSLNSKQSSRSSLPTKERVNLDLPPIPQDLPPLPPTCVIPSPTPSLQPSSSVLHMKLQGNNTVQPVLSSPSSKISLVPSEGEDMDAFHVRNTYAQLEASGVKGDGYEEGIERTRARIGTSRSSQLQANAALGDGKEKTRDLDEKEIQVLKSVDRYGFFTIPSHDRLILLNSTPLLKRLSPTVGGPPNTSPDAFSINSLPLVTIPPKESSRIAKWTHMLIPQKREQGGNVESWRIRPSKEIKFRERIYKGIPDRWRRAAWDLLMSRHSGIGPRGIEKLGEDYRDGLDKPSTYDIQIDLDVPRTISGHIMFRTRYGAGQRSLFHVLHCFSLRCPTCGYVQGMGPIAATLLCYFEPERVYESLVVLHDAYKLHDVFNPGFPGLLEAIYIQERITEMMMPAVYVAFRNHTISTTSYATKWYITLFANSVPFQTQLRLWDVFLLEGYDVFIAVAVAIVWVYRDHITSSSANFETVLSLLSSFFVPEDDNTFLSWVETTLGDKKLRSNMSKWRRDWQELVATGREGTALL